MYDVEGGVRAGRLVQPILEAAPVGRVQVVERLLLRQVLGGEGDQERALGPAVDRDEVDRLDRRTEPVEDLGLRP